MRDFIKINADDIQCTSKTRLYNLIEDWLYNLTEPTTDYTFSNDYIIDTNQDCYFYKENFKDDKHFDCIQFHKINNDFYIGYCNLTSLKGCPKEVYGLFNCTTNLLTTLTDGPQLVHGGYYCGLNKLTSLEGGPSYVKGSFYCSYNPLSSLKEPLPNATISGLTYIQTKTTKNI